MVDKGRSKLCREHLEIRARVENQPGIVVVVIACSKPKMILSRVVMQEQTALAIPTFLLNRGRSGKLIHDIESEE